MTVDLSPSLPLRVGTAKVPRHAEPAQEEEDQVTEIAIQDVKTAEVEGEAKTLAMKAQAFVVSTTAEYQVAGVGLRQIKGVLARIDALFEDSIRTAHAAHKALLALKDKVSSPLRAAETVLKNKMATFATEERRRKEEEARRAAEEARQKEEERAFNEAVAADAAGHTDAALEILDKPVLAPVIPIAEAPKAKGIAARKTFRFEIVDASRLRPEFLIPDERKIADLVRKMGKESEAIVGKGAINVREETVIASRAAGAR